MTLFTTGYQGETISYFIKKLQEEKIDAIIDIRENPFSRKPGFSGKVLSKKLTASGVKYYHFQELGTPKPLREDLALKGNYGVFFENYRNYLLEYKDSLDDLIDIGSNKRICLMCFEKDPHLCHRKVVAELLSEYSGKKITVVHL
ncbi:MAG: DUF488 domain-containing protein [Patescibacteria group bacterium]